MLLSIRFRAPFSLLKSRAVRCEVFVTVPGSSKLGDLGTDGFDWDAALVGCDLGVHMLVLPGEDFLSILSSCLCLLVCMGVRS